MQFIAQIGSTNKPAPLQRYYLLELRKKKRTLSILSNQVLHFMKIWDSKSNYPGVKDQKRCDWKLGLWILAPVWPMPKNNVKGERISVSSR